VPSRSSTGSEHGTSCAAIRCPSIVEEPAELAADREADANMHHFELDPVEDPLTRWRREMDEAEASRAQYRAREAADTNERRTRDWGRWATAIIERQVAVTGFAVSTIGRVMTYVAVGQCPAGRVLAFSPKPISPNSSNRRAEAHHNL
jgi:hypothetical protein